MSQNCTINNGSNGQFYDILFLLQYKNINKTSMSIKKIVVFFLNKELLEREDDNMVRSDGKSWKLDQEV